jgi:hypothetical protein
MTCLQTRVKKRLSALPTTTAITPLGDNVKDHLAGLFAAVLGSDNLDGLVLGLVTGDLDLCARLLAEIVYGGTTGSDNKPVRC